MDRRTFPALTRRGEFFFGVLRGDRRGDLLEEKRRLKKLNIYIYTLLFSVVYLARALRAPLPSGLYKLCLKIR